MKPFVYIHLHCKLIALALIAPIYTTSADIPVPFVDMTHELVPTSIDSTDVTAMFQERPTMRTTSADTAFTTAFGTNYI